MDKKQFTIVTHVSFFRGLELLKRTYQKAAQFVKSLLGIGQELVSDHGKKYTLFKKIGEGGMGTVYRARDDKGREVAVKVTTSEVGLRRFRLETAILKLLEKHPYIPELIDWGLETTKVKFCVMEYVKGDPLDEIIRRQFRWFYGRLLFHTLEVAHCLLMALDHVHRKKIIHRDIKPHNIIVERLSDGKLGVKLMDFGVSKPLEKTFMSFLHRNINFDEKKLTLSGEPIGTLGYAPREQIDNSEPDETADIFSCGVTIYEILQGGFLFRGTALSQYLIELGSFHYTPLTLSPEETEGHPELMERLNFILQKALSLKPGHRYRRAGKMLAEIESLRKEFLRRR